MSELNNSTTVKKQYANSNNLNTRISIHAKYSTNKMGFGNWIVNHYCIENGMRVLELGCGTGDMWCGHDHIIQKCERLVLSDFSEGMLETAKATVSGYSNVQHMVIDIQDIPFENDSFDVVIANMMLYHVPDLEKGLSEVRRVLKDGGAFYCATYGEHGIIEYLSRLLKDYGVEDTINKNFTLQNGSTFLEKVFVHVDKFEYPDALAITDLDDMVNYIYSLSSMTALISVPRDDVKAILSQNMVDGVLMVPKEYGMFIAH